MSAETPTPDASSNDSTTITNKLSFEASAKAVDFFRFMSDWHAPNSPLKAEMERLLGGPLKMTATITGVECVDDKTSATAATTEPPS